ncbi:hypothetical protein EDB81DRAFT_848143 [Dactylonectria macrodidyma]|uniref:BHLH domain-containing protein n=1 Tax=Dactylonectria macrodidyma TaxID=307937 RepID=A0A9P9DGX2_9HYPO|nr:hypothetical protein EDB81DRAFT_848143 [Dactylonectria macrodidyma]
MAMTTSDPPSDGYLMLCECSALNIWSTFGGLDYSIRSCPMCNIGSGNEIRLGHEMNLGGSDTTAQSYNHPSFDDWATAAIQPIIASWTKNEPSAAQTCAQIRNDISIEELDARSRLPVPPDTVLTPPPRFVPQPPRQLQRERNSISTLQRSSSLQHNGPNNSQASSIGQASILQIAQLRHQSLEDFLAENRRNSVDEQFRAAIYERLFGHTRFIFGRKVPRDEFRWEPDTEFHGPFGYEPVLGTGLFNFMQQEQMRCLRCFDIRGSVTPPRSNTPTGPQHSAAAKADVQEVSKEQKTAQPTRLGRTKGRKNGGKKPGQNRKLTEREKKENHIQGEKKRRALIQQGFEDLRQLVPELRTDKYSKSTTLFIAAVCLTNAPASGEKGHGRSSHNASQRTGRTSRPKVMHLNGLISKVVNGDGNSCKFLPDMYLHSLAIKNHHWITTTGWMEVLGQNLSLRAKRWINMSKSTSSYM